MVKYPLQLISCCSISKSGPVLTRVLKIWLQGLRKNIGGLTHRIHQTRKPFYITPCRQKRPPALWENFASKLTETVDPASFQKWIGPLANRLSRSFKNLFFSVWETGGEFCKLSPPHKTQLSLESDFLYIFIIDFSRRQMNLFNKAWRLYQTHICLLIVVKCTGVHPTQGTQITHLRLYWLFKWICRKRLGSNWTFNILRPQWYKDRCVCCAFSR